MPSALPVSAQVAIRLKAILSALLLVALLLGLPLLGVAVDGGDIRKYLEFPPTTQYVEHPGFSWLVFGAILFVIISMVGPFLTARDRTKPRHDASASPSRGFPWWGWLGVCEGLSAWLLAWTRFEWMEPFQLYTFPAIWLGYIVVINALTYRRSGGCMLLYRPRTFLILFPTSAVFWWFFEYLNRFVQNWHYVVPEELSAFEYTLIASLCFATVLPAVLGTADWIKTFPGLRERFANWFPLPVRRPVPLGVLVFSISSFLLLSIGLWPQVLYPFVWVAPLLLIVSWQSALGFRSIISPVVRGDWSNVVSAALAGLMCGLLWELWNYYSWAKWIYSIPFVQRPDLMLFEMPILGYGGYLPFGLECLAVGSIVTVLVGESDALVK